MNSIEIEETLIKYADTRIDFERIVRRSYFDFLPFIKKYQRMYIEQLY